MQSWALMHIFVEHFLLWIWVIRCIYIYVHSITGAKTSRPGQDSPGDGVMHSREGSRISDYECPCSIVWPCALGLLVTAMQNFVVYNASRDIEWDSDACWLMNRIYMPWIAAIATPYWKCLHKVLDGRRITRLRLSVAAKWYLHIRQIWGW